MPISNDPKKDTIYVDVDDEITAIIEKLQNSPQKIVALVLPKRATVLQSAVNMKLLKRMADNAKKSVVLITSEAGLLPLAGSVGLYVANSLQSRPEIPAGPMRDSMPDLSINEDEPEDSFDPAAVADAPIGALAGLPEATAVPAASAAVAAAYDEPETIELDNADADIPTAAAAPAAVKPGKNKGKDKKLKVPNFNRFRTVLIIAILVILLLGGGFIYANIALAKAVVTLQTNSTDISTKASLSLDPTATTADVSQGTLPAKVVSKQKTDSQQASTTGTKNNGTKATGSVTLSLTDCSNDSVAIPAGTGVSTGNQTFITQSATNLQSVKIGGTCRNSDFKNVSTDQVSVVAQTAGAAGNISATSKFAVAGFSNVTGSSSDPMTGGTDSIIKVVAQADIDAAKAKISSQDTSGIRDELTTQLSSAGYKAISSSLFSSDPIITPSAKVGDQADTVTVSQVTTYSLYGVKQADLKQVITASVNKQIDTTKQQILKDGLDQAKYTIASPAASGAIDLTLTATSLAGPDIDSNKLAAQIAGKQTGDVESAVKAIPGVSDVSVKYSPFWVHKVPKNTAKIAIIIEKAGGGSTTLQSSND